MFKSDNWNSIQDKEVIDIFLGILCENISILFLTFYILFIDMLKTACGNNTHDRDYR